MKYDEWYTGSAIAHVVKDFLMALVIGHRGASAYAPENTIRSFELARSQGADMVELDVQRSSDGVLIVFHDDTTERWNGLKRTVGSYSYDELLELDIGGERIATLEETCAFASETGMQLNVELKQPDIVGPTVEMLRAHGIVEQTVISSFYHAALVALHQEAPDVRGAYLMGNDSYRPDVRARELWPFFQLQQVGAYAWHPYWKLPMLDKVLPLVRQAGYRVNVWTVNDPVVAKRLTELGATGIITDMPDVMSELKG